jgi:hypothetical protein
MRKAIEMKGSKKVYVEKKELLKKTVSESLILPKKKSNAIMQKENIAALNTCR